MNLVIKIVERFELLIDDIKAFVYVGHWNRAGSVVQTIEDVCKPIIAVFSGYDSCKRCNRQYESVCGPACTRCLNCTVPVFQVIPLKFTFGDIVGCNCGSISLALGFMDAKGSPNLWQDGLAREIQSFVDVMPSIVQVRLTLEYSSLADISYAWQVLTKILEPRECAGGCHSKV